MPFSATPFALASRASECLPTACVLLQEYVMNPMTFQGHKFDLRIWAICTSLDPLRVYLMGSGIPKVSQWKYVKDKSQVKNCQRGTLTAHHSPLTAHRASPIYR